jgi:hypothetical protein
LLQFSQEKPAFYQSLVDFFIKFAIIQVVRGVMVKKEVAMRRILILSISLFFAFSTSVYAVVPAFPGAEGVSKYITGGRGADVYEVTTLADYRAYVDTPIQGSLRYGIMREDFLPTARNVPRIIVFRVSGTIELVGELTIEYGNLTIAGQTAPGDGITLKNRTLSISNSVYANNIIIRYIRVRLGEGPVVPAGRANQGEVDAITFGGAKNVILDHISSSWGIDETMSFNQSADVNNITFQWCMITEGLNKSLHPKGPHSKGTLLYSEYGKKFSFHHNIYAHNADRNPRITGQYNYITDPNGIYWDFRNNVVYNWGGSYAGHCPSSNTVTHLNIVNNYYKQGVDSAAPIAWEERSLHSQGYVNGNWMDGVDPCDPWSVVRFVGLTDANIATYKRFSEIPIAPMPTDDALTAYHKVLADAGCTVPYRDTVDARVVNEIVTGTGRVIDCTEANDFYSYIAYAQAGTSNTITLASSDKHSILDALNGYDIKILSGTGANQLRTIADYDNGTKIATVSSDWDTIPDTTSQYAIVIYCDKNAYGWPVLTSTTPPTDSDHDGMPDAWETAKSLNPNDANDGKLDRDSDGYTNVEEYLNWLVDKKAALPADFDNDGNVDYNDLDLFTEDWMENDCNSVPRRNLDVDCDVDLKDYAVLADEWLDEYLY